MACDHSDDHRRVKAAFDKGLISEDQVAAAFQSEMTTLENPGFCLECGNEQGGCEPDARNYECERCGKHAVFGAAEICLSM